MFRIAVNLAGFDAAELMTEIHRRTARSKAEKVNLATVENAMQTVFDRHRGEERRAQQKEARARLLGE